MSNYGLCGFVDFESTTTIVQNSFNNISYDEESNVITFTVSESEEKCYSAVSFVIDAITEKRNIYRRILQMRGTVKFFYRSKGWGFVTNNETDKDVFIHQSSIQMSGYRTLDEGDLVDYEIGVGNNGREQAINVTPIITLSMVVHELAKEGLHTMRIRDDKGVHGWYVVDKSDKPVMDKEMSLLDLAAYVGIDVEGLE